MLLYRYTLIITYWMAKTAKSLTQIPHNLPAMGHLRNNGRCVTEGQVVSGEWLVVNGWFRRLCAVQSL